MLYLLICLLTGVGVLPITLETAYKKVCRFNYFTIIYLMILFLMLAVTAMIHSLWILLFSSIAGFLQLMFISLFKIKSI